MTDRPSYESTIELAVGGHRLPSHIVSVEGSESEVSCRFCSTIWAVTVSAEQLVQWRLGAYLTECAPQLDPDDRELLISGMCPDCWERIIENSDVTDG